VVTLLTARLTGSDSSMYYVALSDLRTAFCGGTGATALDASDDGFCPVFGPKQ